MPRAENLQEFNNSISPTLVSRLPYENLVSFPDCFFPKKAGMGTRLTKKRSGLLNAMAHSALHACLRVWRTHLTLQGLAG